MNFRRKRITIRSLTGIVTGCMIFGVAFAGGYPAAAAVASDCVGISKQSIQILGLDKARDEKSLFDEYAACGIERKGGSYYYEGKRVKVIKDRSVDSSFYKFDPKLKGKVSIKVVRNKKGKIRRVSYMTKKEASKLIRRAGLKEN